MDDPLVIIALSIFGSVTASSGFWILVNRFADRKSATTKLVLGLTRDKLIHLGMGYVDRGFITKEEYEAYMTFFWEPYSTFGPDELSKKVVEAVKGLPIRKPQRYTGQIPTPVKES